MRRLFFITTSVVFVLLLVISQKQLVSGSQIVKDIVYTPKGVTAVNTQGNAGRFVWQNSQASLTKSLDDKSELTEFNLENSAGLVSSGTESTNASTTNSSGEETETSSDEEIVEESETNPVGEVAGENTEVETPAEIPLEETLSEEEDVAEEETEVVEIMPADDEPAVIEDPTPVEESEVSRATKIFRKLSAWFKSDTAQAAIGNTNPKPSPFLEFDQFVTENNWSGWKSQAVKLRLSVAGLSWPGSTLEISYSLDNETWTGVGEISFDELRSTKTEGGLFEVTLPDFNQETNLADLKIRLRYIANGDEPEPILDSTYTFFYVDHLDLITEHHQSTENGPASGGGSSSDTVSEVSEVTNNGENENASTTTEEINLVATSTEELLLEVATTTATTTDEVKEDPITEINYSNEAFDLLFPTDLESPITITKRTVGVSLPLELSVVGASREATPQKEGQTVRYEEVLPNTDFVYQATKTGIKETIILKTEDHSNKIVYRLNLARYDAIKSGNNTIEIYEKGHLGEPLYKTYVISAPYMVDDSGVENRNITLELDGNLLTLTPDADFLANASYPVAVDPTVDISVITLYSHPLAGEEWVVDFRTAGTADLTISPTTQATINDMDYVSLACDGELRQADVLVGDVISYDDWTCDGIGTITHYINVEGSHILAFKFGDAPTVQAFNGTVVWDGGAGTNDWEDAANWNGDLTPAAGDDVVIDTAVTVNLNMATTVQSLTLGVSGGGTASTLNFDYDALNDPLTVSDDFIIYGSAVMTHTVGSSAIGGRIDVDIGGNATVTGSININEKGYIPQNGPGKGGDGTDNGGGASYGGIGSGNGNATNGGPGTAYGSTTAPTDIGSGGGRATRGSVGSGGKGGGAVKLDVAGNLNVGGTISSNGGDGSTDWGQGAGSGGSIYLIVGGSLSGSGTIRANGGNGGGFRGSAGGGRIAIVDYTSDTSSFTLTAYGQTKSSYQSGAGTILKRSSSQAGGALTIDNNSLGSDPLLLGRTEFGTTTVTSVFDSIVITDSGSLYATSTAVATTTSLTLSNNGHYNARNGTTLGYTTLTSWTGGHVTDGGGTFPLLTENQDLTIPSGSILILDEAGATRTYNDLTINGTLAHTDNGGAVTADADSTLYKINYTLDNLTIASGASVDVDYLGYGYGEGPGSAADASNLTGGAGHGGEGGDGHTTVGGNVYGSTTAPTALGSGGGNATSAGNNGAGDGGGAVIFTVSDTTDIDGSITANGEDATGCWGHGGGSGGSIYLSTGTLTGSGSMSVIGGDGCSGGGGDGAGGRIAIVYTTDSSSITYNTYSGNGTSRYGGSGTLYKKAAANTYGDLTLDNNDLGGSTEANFGRTFIYNITDFNDLTLQDSSYLDATSTQTLNIYGDLTIDTSQASSTYITLQTSGTTDNTISQTGPFGFPPLVINKSSATSTLSTLLNSSTTITISGGGFNTNNKALLSSGLLTVSGGQYQAGTSTQTLNGGLTFSSGLVLASTTTFDIDGDFTHSGGIFSAPTSTMSLTGDFNRSGGTFIHNSGTVNLDGFSQTIAGDTTFYNFTKSTSTTDTLTFTAGTTQTIAGTMTLSGATSNLLSLRSSVTDTAWLINPQGTRSISYLDVKDSTNSNLLTINAIDTNSTDSDGNTNWIFTAPTFTQGDFQFFENTDALQPATSLGLQNASTVIYSTSTPIRLRMNLTVANTLPANYQQFKLQVSTATTSGWQDVSAPDWWDEDWSSRLKITFDNSDSAVDLDNFPVHIALNATSLNNIDYSLTQNSGQDIRFVDAYSGTELAYEIEKWDESATSTIWVKVPSIQAASTTDHIWMYYNNSDASDNQNATAVWGPEYDAVWHLSQDPATAGADGILDSTANNYDGTDNGGMDDNDQINGVTDGSIDFDGSNDYIVTDTLGTFGSNLDGSVLSFWIKTTTTTVQKAVFGTINDGSSMIYLVNLNRGNPGINNDSVGYTQFYIRSDDNQFLVGTIDDDIYDGEWHHIVWNIVDTSSNNFDVYLDGAEVSVNFTDTGGPTNFANFDYPIVLGARNARGTIDQNAAVNLDEVRLATTTKSADWIEAQYKSDYGTLASYGDQEAVSTFFANNASVTSSTTISAVLLSTSNVRGTYQEGNPSAVNPFAISAGEYVEYDFAINPQNLVADTTYYFRMVESDGTVFDTYSNYPALTFEENIAPDAPSSLGPSTLVDGSSGTDTTPAFTFTLSDDNSSHTIKYSILIDNDSDFSSPVIDYTSALQTQGSATFTVGQSAGSGVYTVGSSGQTLTDASYYWRVSAIDQENGVSATTTANSGAIAFVIDTVVPDDEGGDSGGGVGSTPADPPENPVDKTILVCHIPPGNPDNARTIEIPTSSLSGHLNHGDYSGPCLSNPPTEEPPVKPLPPEEEPVEVEEPSTPVEEVVGTIAETIFSSSPGSLVTGLVKNVLGQIVNYYPKATEQVQQVNRVNVTIVGPAIVAGQLYGGAVLQNIANGRLWSEVWKWLSQALHLFAGAFGLRKRSKIWGTVYDAKTKQPIDPAVVQLINADTKEVVEEAITDISGRYGFLVKPGRYLLKAGKTHYTFPSTTVTADNDGLFNNVYHGEIIEITEESKVIAPNIPMDAEAFDWNQSAKLDVVDLKPKLNSFIKKLFAVIFWIGFGLVVFGFVTNPNMTNSVWAMIYVGLFVLRHLMPHGQMWGRIYKGSDATPLVDVNLELTYPDNDDVTIARARVAADGKFFLKADRGNYNLHIVRRVSGQKITLGTVPVTVGRHGLINKDIILA